MKKFNPEIEVERITGFIKQTLEKSGKQSVVLGLSGGIDSATCLYLLRKVIPKEHIFIYHLPYFEKDKDLAELTNGFENVTILSMKKEVDMLAEIFDAQEKVRFGNIAARVRMIALFDAAKKHNALVCGTENKTEYYLGYFTRFGDEASDFEPIQHLYKTEVIKLAEYLDVPSEIITKSPSANLWEGQTDEGQLGFSYKEADAVLRLSIEEKKEVSEIEKEYPNALKIIVWVKQNEFKHKVPYTLDLPK